MASGGAGSGPSAYTTELIKRQLIGKLLPFLTVMTEKMTEKLTGKLTGKMTEKMTRKMTQKLFPDRLPCPASMWQMLPSAQLHASNHVGRHWFHEM